VGIRTSLFNELIVGNDADYQRAFEAAQAILQDAELDIRGENLMAAFAHPMTATEIYADARLQKRSR
jgi:Tfp pilus assembly protein PilX